ncbi:MAG: TonB-dependent receptor [Pyrinomonadaceae bacterium]|nr:TonB-dependent receptor [Pyrinomonadaceae bacterium]
MKFSTKDALLLRPVLLFTFSIFCAFAVVAAPSSNLTGVVVDVNKAVVASANVEIVNLGTNAKINVTTNGEGRFTALELASGAYRVAVSKSGFQTIIKENVVVTIAATTTENFTLAVAGLDSTVTIESDGGELIERDSGAVGTFINHRFIENLPLNGRSFQTLIELTPGVTPTNPTIQNSGQFSVNGQRSNANYFIVDGVSANIGTSTNAQFYQQAGGTLPGLSILGGTNSLASVDAVEEFRVQTSSYGAEYGRQPGGQVILNTRSGKNAVNFTAFEYFRNEKLDANDWFDNRAGIARRPLRQNIYGGVVGGPVFLPRFGEGTPALYDGRNKTFFFFSYEGTKLIQPQPQILLARVPTRDARTRGTGLFAQILNAFPLPNLPSQPGGNVGFINTELYQGGLSYPSKVDATSFRIDQIITNKINLFGRYNDSPSSQRFRSFPTQENAFGIKIKTLTLGAIWNISPKLTNDLRFNYSYNRGTFDFAGIEVDGSTLISAGSLLPSFADARTTAISVFLDTGNFSQGITSANLSQGKTLGTKQRQYNVVNDLTAIAGNHILKFGVDYRRLLPTFDSRSVGISYTFGNFRNGTNPALWSVPTAVSVQSFAPVTDFYINNFSAYASDSWRVSKSLNLNFGLRWEVNPPLQGDKLPYNADQVDNPLTSKLAPFGTKQWKTTYNNFAPRIGFAYNLPERFDAVIRGGFGVFYDLGTGTALRGYNSFPYNTSKNLSGTQLRFPALDSDLQPPAFLDPNVTPYSSGFQFFDRNLKLPRTFQYNFSIEKGFGRNQSVTLSYVGARGRKLLRVEQLQNFTRGFVQQRFCPQDPNPTACAATAQPLVLVNPMLFGPADLNSASALSGSTVAITRNGAASDYNALQAQYQRRLSRGLQALVSYTLANSLDSVSEETTIGFASGYDAGKLERGTSAFDIKHNFVAAVSFDLPRINSNGFVRSIINGWSVDSIIRIRTALPFSVITQAFDPLNIGTTRRNNLVAGVPAWLNDANAPGGRRLNPDAFTLPELGKQGTQGRNSFRAFAQRQVDLTVRREFGLTEKLKLQFRADAFNVFNLANFNTPANSCTAATINAACVDNGTFGRAQSMLGRGLSGVGSGTQTGPSPGFNPLYNVGGPRSLQFALKLIY